MPFVVPHLQGVAEMKNRASFSRLASGDHLLCKTLESRRVDSAVRQREHPAQMITFPDISFHHTGAAAQHHHRHCLEVKAGLHCRRQQMFRIYAALLPNHLSGLLVQRTG